MKKYLAFMSVMAFSCAHAQPPVAYKEPTDKQISFWVSVALTRWHQINPSWDECAADGVHEAEIEFAGHCPVNALINDKYVPVYGYTTIYFNTVKRKMVKSIVVSSCAEGNVLIHELGHLVLLACSSGLPWDNDAHHKYFKAVEYGY